MTQKEKALEAMQKMNIFKPYIRAFREKDRVCFFENFAGFWVDQEPEIYAKMKELEEECGVKVYAITHEKTSFGELYDFLLVSAHPEDWEYTVEGEGYRLAAFAYVWNKDNEMFSEFGSIEVVCSGGGIARVA